MKYQIKFALFLSLLVGILLFGCTTKVVQSPIESPAKGDTLWPTHGWQTSTPAQQGLDPVLLDKMQAAVKEQQINLHSLLIIRNGYIVSETYYGNQSQNTPHVLYSVTKSFVSTLIGIALDQGKLKTVDQLALDLLPPQTYANPDPRKQAITVENLLTMSSGLAWKEGDPAYRELYMSRNWVKTVLDLPIAADPGSTFNYCSGCTHILSAILHETVGINQFDFAIKYLFNPLGISNPQWETDAQGILIGGWGLNLTPRDMAKLGYLYLHNGIWEGKQVVSSSWVKAATTKHIRSDGSLGYGYQWWTYPTHDAYTALGRAGQTIFVVPSLNLIVVTTADLPAGHEPIFNLIDNYILPAVK